MGPVDKKQDKSNLANNDSVIGKKMLLTLLSKDTCTNNCSLRLALGFAKSNPGFATSLVEIWTEELNSRYKIRKLDINIQKEMDRYMDTNC